MLHFDRCLRKAALALLFGSLLVVGGCVNESIEDTCSTLAESHCSQCFQCAEGSDLSGAELCNITAAQDQTRGACEAILQSQCEGQARVMQDPFDEMDRCQGALEDQTCEDLFERDALDQPSSPDVCQRFL